jgi:hypothetical protein
LTTKAKLAFGTRLSRAGNVIAELTKIIFPNYLVRLTLAYPYLSYKQSRSLHSKY